MFALDLGGRTAVVTGGGQGLGLATASALHAAGANVVITYFADPAGANRALAESAVAGFGERALALPGDVRDAAAIAAVLAATVRRFGALDIVVNNAGIISDRTVAKMSPEAWDAVIDTNLTGVFNVCKAATSVIADGGRIVNLASISAIVGFFGQANYAAAKAGVIALTKVLSRELAARAITVNAVAPGVVQTDMIRSIPAEASARMLANIPLQRFGEPREIAEVVLFLCSGSASYVTGQTIHVNGGWWG